MILAHPLDMILSARSSYYSNNVYVSILQVYNEGLNWTMQMCSLICAFVVSINDKGSCLIS